MTVGLNLREYLAQNSTVDSTLTQLLLSLMEACKDIGKAIAKGAIEDVLGSAGTDNIQGEEQKKLDVLSNDILLTQLQSLGLLAAMASEEMDDIYPIPAPYKKGKYFLLFDPLDGSSNIDVNVSVGTIFSILESQQVDQEPTEVDFLQAGTKQKAAGYVLYGPSTLLVLSLGAGVDAFTLDQDTGEFVLTQKQMRVPEATKEFAINMSNQRFWEQPIQRYVEELLMGTAGPRAKDFNMRWVASMVADVHRILTRGGIFMYPLDSKTQSKGGKLRLMYEANPMSFLIEQAGGAACTGRERILSLNPQKLHQRIPVVLGSKEEVERVLSYHNE
jgi:fructose-1,6-bisphosphatase I